MTTSSSGATFERGVGRARRRLVPFLVLMYILNYLDRVNIGYAKEALQLSTGISEAAFALAAGVFFFGYAIFELPSNLVLHRICGFQLSNRQRSGVQTDRTSEG